MCTRVLMSPHMRTARQSILSSKAGQDHQVPTASSAAHRQPLPSPGNPLCQTTVPQNPGERSFNERENCKQAKTSQGEAGGQRSARAGSEDHGGTEA